MREHAADQSPGASETIIVGRIGKPHGVRGEVTVESRTDTPERRFATGNRLVAGERSLTVAAYRVHQGRLLVRFEDVDHRDQAEQLRGSELTCAFDPDEVSEDPEEFYDHQLVGLRAESPSGEPIGTVARVLHGAAQDILVVDVEGREVLVPFVGALVPEVDLAGRRLVFDDRPGLLGEL